MVLVVAAVSVWQGRDSPGCCGGFATKNYPASPPCFDAAFGSCGGSTRKLGNSWCFGKQTFPVCCRYFAEGALADEWGDK